MISVIWGRLLCTIKNPNGKSLRLTKERMVAALFFISSVIKLSGILARKLLVYNKSRRLISILVNKGRKNYHLEG